MTREQATRYWETTNFTHTANLKNTMNIPLKSSITWLDQYETQAMYISNVNLLFIPFFFSWCRLFLTLFFSILFFFFFSLRGWNRIQLWKAYDYQLPTQNVIHRYATHTNIRGHCKSTIPSTPHQANIPSNHNLNWLHRLPTDKLEAMLIRIG